ncbi:MAG: radical SAM protein [Deltaproteobacteria bacterium]|nr:radical SAM protein [Deltaproteobacteria bacterium]MBW2070598.1 radical SAM protein [Deltaproteobacteria bacterium]
MTGSSAASWQRVDERTLIPLPAGSELFVLPGRLPVGYDRRSGSFQVVTDDPYAAGKKVQAVAAFMAPAHTQILTAAYYRRRNAPVLPLFSYTAVGWKEGQFWVAGIRVDEDRRQDSDQFNEDRLRRQARDYLERLPHNRLVQHLGKCALTYGCPAAKNFFLERWEAPLPSSPVCNAACLGCISLQQGTPICASQDRISFVPRAEELAEVALGHLQRAAAPVVSFGQGCEGEPLLQGKTLAAAVKKVRQQSGRGTINLNTNGSLPQVVAQLRQYGLDSIRVSLNSARQYYYCRYYRPRGFDLKEVKESMQVMKMSKGFVSINLLTLPGLTDEDEEVEALIRLIDDTNLDLIQMRNLNIDPEWYLSGINYQPRANKHGILGMMAHIKKHHPQVKFGYFNPCLSPA